MSIRHYNIDRHIPSYVHKSVAEINVTETTFSRSSAPCIPATLHARMNCCPPCGAGLLPIRWVKHQTHTCSIYFPINGDDEYEACSGNVQGQVNEREGQ